jgi:chorismate lyase/3-hydroxybenzoate synthase
MHRSLADDASTPIHKAQETSPARPVTKEFTFPSWVDQWIGPDAAPETIRVGSLRLTCRLAAGRAYLAAEADVHALSDPEFCQAARQIYACLAERAGAVRRHHPIRLWNWIPQIHRQTVDGDRYMSFNLGRYEAMREWFGDDLSTRVPAASGVGCDDGVLRVAALLSDEPGRQIENPRQVPAYRYSARFGRMPPCFARATRWSNLLLIAGTAAVVGEESQHAGEFERQLDITLSHLELMLERGLEGEEDARFTSFRAYLPPQPRLPERAAAVRSALRSLAQTRVELLAADLCRPDLLVEIEAVGQCR